MKNIVIALVILYSLLLIGCPKADKTVRTLREKSAEMSIYGGKLVTAFGDAYRAGEISQSQLADLNRATGAFTTALGVYRDAVTQAEKTVRETGELPAGTIDRLAAVLNAQVVAAFFDILVKVGAMPLAQSAAVQAIISSIRMTILVIQGVFSDARHQLDRPTAALAEV